MKEKLTRLWVLVALLTLASCSNEEESAIRPMVSSDEVVTFTRSTEESAENVPVALEGIYFLHEEKTTPVYTLQSFSDSQEVQGIYTSKVEVSIKTDEEENYLILIDDYTEFVSVVKSGIEEELELPEGSYLTLYDLTLQVTSSTQAIALVKSVAISPVTVPTLPIFPTPMGKVYGADLNGWCNVPNIVTDAAVFINGVIQPLAASNVTGSTCPTIATRYIFTMGFMDTSNSGSVTFGHGLTWSYALNSVWKDYTNSCVGDNDPVVNEAIWQGLYNKARNLVMAGVPTYQQWGNAVFAYGTINSETFSNAGYKLDNLYDFFHKGMFFYGLEIC